MTDKELAKAFGVKVGELCVMIGYSRSGLYLEISNKRKSSRFNSALDHLQFISDKQYEEDIAQAKINKNTRDKMIAELKERGSVE